MSSIECKKHFLIILAYFDILVELITYANIEKYLRGQFPGKLISKRGDQHWHFSCFR